jgi:hypothetical protein
MPTNIKQQFASTVKKLNNLKIKKLNLFQKKLIQLLIINEARKLADIKNLEYLKKIKNNREKAPNKETN